MQTHKATFLDVYGYTLAHLWLLLPAVSLVLLGSAVWAAAALAMGVPVLDHLFGQYHDNVEYTEFQKRFLDALATWYGVSIGVAFVGTLLLLAYFPMTQAQAVGLALSSGAVFAAQVLAGGHELGHRPGRWAQGWTRAMHIAIGYGHFQVGHIRQHHLWVGTPQDPICAPRGMSIYAYMPRAIVGEFRDAWKSERKRLAGLGLPTVSWKNEVLTNLVGSLLLAGVCALVAGWLGVLFFGVLVVSSHFIMSAVNFLQHYGLPRKQLANGQYEPVTARHTWNSPYRFSCWRLLNQERHVDHHLHGGRKYYQLQSVPGAPVLPGCYVAMIPTLLVPSVFRRIAHPIMDRLDSPIESKQA